MGIPGIYSSNNLPKFQVRFALEPVISVEFTWDITYAADLRSGDIWMQEARDRDRFKRRIQTIETSLSPVLHHIHRQKVFTERFGLEF